MPCELKRECRKHAVLAAIDLIPQVSEDDIVKCTGLSDRTIRYIVNKLRVESGVKIERTPSKGTRLSTYEIVDPGCFNLKNIPKLLSEKCPEVLSEIVRAAKERHIKFQKPVE